MANLQGMITDIIETGGEMAAQVRLNRAIFPLPGQYLQAKVVQGSEAMPVTVLPVDSGGEGLRILPLTPQNWHVGDQINLRGPLGNGFHLPTGSEKIGLVSFGQGKAAPLLPLAQVLLASGKEVALVTDSPLQGLPMALEILPGDQQVEVAIWADALAICAGRQDIPDLLKRLGREASRKAMEVLILTEMPCAGLAACGICAIKTKKGWKLACKDGPVFPFAELVEE
ncbi:MAG: hypothetical protein AB9897_04355 [Anaerolineaceae bacterium]